MLEMLTGAGLFLLGALVDRFFLARGRGTKAPKAVCGCGHELAFHDPETQGCHGRNQRVKHNKWGDKIGFEHVPCTCRQYDGPTPLPTVYAPEVTG